MIPPDHQNLFSVFTDKFSFRSCPGKEIIYLLFPVLRRCVNGASQVRSPQFPQGRKISAGNGVMAVTKLSGKNVTGQIDGLPSEVQQNKRPVKPLN